MGISKRSPQAFRRFHTRFASHRFSFCSGQRQAGGYRPYPACFVLLAPSIPLTKKGPWKHGPPRVFVFQYTYDTTSFCKSLPVFFPPYDFGSCACPLFSSTILPHLPQKIFPFFSQFRSAPCRTGPGQTCGGLCLASGRRWTAPPPAPCTAAPRFPAPGTGKTGGAPTFPPG